MNSPIINKQTYSGSITLYLTLEFEIPITIFQNDYDLFDLYLS